SYRLVKLKARPKGEIIPSNVFEVVEKPIPTLNSLPENGIVVRVKYLSLDPTLRSFISGVDTYMKAVQIGEVMRAWGIGVIELTKNPKFKLGDLCFGMFGFTEFYTSDNGAGIATFSTPLPKGINEYDLLGVLGTTGLTAFTGLETIAQNYKLNPEAKSTVVVSGAAGGTGIIVGQIAKLKGAKNVIGIAGSAEKCRLLKEEYGFDHALNYKSPSFKRQFIKLTTNPETKAGTIDLYWDNVGGEILDLALNQAADNAFFVMCGAISEYNNQGPPDGLRNYANIITKRLTLKGFVIIDHVKGYDQARKKLITWISEGKLKTKTTIISGEINRAPQALVSLFKGENIGKLVFRIN
ncbi:NAD(P)-binding protein, partial [Nadsonia fulvescens var. elongata DSM 6958]